MLLLYLLKGQTQNLWKHRGVLMPNLHICVSASSAPGHDAAWRWSLFLFIPVKQHKVLNWACCQDVTKNLCLV